MVSLYTCITSLHDPLLLPTLILIALSIKFRLTARIKSV